MKNIEYKFCKEYLYNKDKYVKQYVTDMLTKTSRMFVYDNLPDTIPVRILERFLQNNGNCIFTKYNDKYYVFTGALGGELDCYYEYTKFIVANPALKLNKEYTINVDCVLIRNDSNMTGLLPLLSKNAVINNDSEITLNVATKTLRAMLAISASDDKTKASAQKYIDDLDNGRINVIAENAFLDGVKLHNGVSVQSGYLQSLIEITQYQRASAYNDIGLNANYNMKRERLTASESELNNAILLPMARDMLECRKEALKAINEKYNLNISVDLAGAWKLEKELQEQQIETVDTPMENENFETEGEQNVDNVENVVVDNDNV